MINVINLFQKQFNKYVFKCDTLRFNLIENHNIKNFYSTKKVKEMKYLNVAEKHDAAKNITSILSNGSARRREGLCVYNKVFDFETNVKSQNCKMVMTSVSGHLLNYEFLSSYKGWSNCSPEQLFDAPIRKNILNNDTGEKIKKTIEREIKSCQGLIIWTDCDREGENIGFEIIEVCQAIRPNLKIFRAKFSEITRQAIFRAINNLVQPDIKQNEAVNIRQELDLRTGAAFTRYQTLRLQKLFPGTTAEKLISYGSCQIPTLGFVAERYKEVEDFESEPFWKLKVIHTLDDLTVEFLWARHRLFNKEMVEDYLLLCLADPKAKVENKTVKPKSKWRPQPMDTVELEKLGSRKLKINAKETMTIAEKLYNKGLISYPRTETNSFSPDINLKSLIEQHTPHSEWGDFASRVLQWGPNPRNGKKTDEAHPPIHPTKFTTDISGNEARVYELIVRHFLACVSKDATGSETIVYIDIAGEKFSANGLVIYERNYLDVYPYEKWNAKQIHHYEIGQIFEPTEISMQEGATTAPPLLTEADLIALMEKHGIGTDATHAEHIHTIKERGYIGEIENGLLVPGTIGMGLYEGYGAMDLELAKPRLRAEFESDLKKVCNGEKNAQIVLREQIVKYKEAYHLITQRVSLMDEKFAKRVNETPSNRRDRNDRDPNGGSYRSNGNNGDNDSDDDGDDGNNPPRGGAFNSRHTESNSDEFIPQRLQEVFPCPKCKVCQMALKKKKDGSSYMIGCSNFPDCKNVIWLSDAIKEAKLSENYCNICGDKKNLSSLSKKINFKFKNTSYLALLNSSDHIYTTCVRCDSKFREIFDINLDQVKFVGNIVGNNNISNEKINLKMTGKITSEKKTTGKKTSKELNSNQVKQNSKQNFSTNCQSTSFNRKEEENIGWVFDDGDDLFENDGFDNVLTKLSTSHEENAQKLNSNVETTNITIRNNDVERSQIKQNIDQYFKSLHKSSTSTNSSPQSNVGNKSTSGWGALQYKSDASHENIRSESQNKRQNSSKWINLSEGNNSKLSNINDVTDNNYKWGYNSEQPKIKKFKNNDLDEINSTKRINNPILSENNELEIKCKVCNKPTRKQIVKKEGPNKGREFYSCGSTCNFFQWADEPVQNESSSTSAQWGSFSGAIQVEKCDCHKPAIQLQVRKDGPNQGKFFLKCKEQKCKFFKWIGDDDENLNRNTFQTNSWGKNNSKKNNRDEVSEPKKRKCGLCRMEGHTKKKCPRKEEFGEF